MKEQKYGIAEFAAAHGLTRDKRECYGVYKGYRVHVRYKAMGNPSCILTVVTDTKGNGKAIEQYLDRHRQDLHIAQYGVIGIGLMVCPQLYRGIFKKIEQILDAIVSKLAKLGCPGADVCPYCGKPMGEDRTSLRESGIPFYAHAACAHGAYAAAVERDRAERARPDRLGRGLLGLLVGMLAGAALLILLFLALDFMAFASAAAVLLGGWLYGKFGGKNSAHKVALCTVVPFVLLAGVYVLCLYLDAAPQGGWQHIADLWAADAKYRNGIIVNAAFFVAFDLLGMVYLLFSYLRGRRSLARDMRVGEE